MRALLVVNEFATATTPATRRAVTDFLRGALDVTIEATQGPGHAVELARMAAASGYDTVITLGGDGTVNEAATGLIGGPGALAPLPGGNANVFARNIGYSPDPMTAARQLVAAATQGRVSHVGVGQVRAEGVDRYFLSNAGVGLDAAVMARMAARRAARQQAGSRRGRPTDLQYARMALSEYVLRTDRQAVPLLVDGYSAALALVVNLSPWTYAGSRALNPHPRAGLTDGLAVYAPQRLTAGAFGRLLATIAQGRNVAREGIYAASDRPSIELSADRPMWLQVDGEAVGQISRATFTHLPGALSVTM